jgi:hypothetical protein
MKRVPTLLGLAVALALFSLSLASCATCEASGSNSHQTGRCGLFQNF